jgi:Holliday junction resolvasome RuvABC endonuclease subunit
MLKLGRAQGVAMAAALERYSDYWMNLRKLNGYYWNGNATKEQVAKMLQQLGLKELPKTSIVLMD